MSIKLNNNVGKNCFTANPADVMVVQTALANIKIKTKFGTKPVWQGKIDGKNSKELVSAIENLEAAEGIPVTGKVQAFGGQTLQKIKQKTPSTIAANLDAKKSSVSSISEANKIKIKAHVKATVKKINETLAMPKKELNGLTKVVEKCGESLIPLTVKEWSISTDGSFKIEFKIEDFILSDVKEKEKYKADLIKKVGVQFEGSDTWKKGANNDLKFQSKKAYTSLKTEKPSSDFETYHKFKKDKVTKEIKRYLAHLEKQITKPKQTPDLAIDATLDILIKFKVIESSVKDYYVNLAKGKFKTKDLFKTSDTTKMSDDGINFMTGWEGKVMNKEKTKHILYDNDGGGHCTIGYGHLVHTGKCERKESNAKEKEYLQGITDAKAKELYKEDIKDREASLRTAFKDIFITQNIFDAVMSIHYNANVSSNWKLVKRLKVGDYIGAANELDVTTSGKSEVSGLKKRRAAEKVVFKILCHFARLHEKRNDLWTMINPPLILMQLLKRCNPARI